MGVTRIFSQAMASAASVATFDLSKGWDRVYLQVPTMPSSTAFDVYAGGSGGSVSSLRRDAGTNALVTFIVAASCSANGAMVPLPGGFQFYKIQATDSAPTAATTFNICCADSD